MPKFESKPRVWPSEVAQIERPYYSTIAFEEFLRRHGVWKPQTEVIDIGTGIGANLFYFRERNPEIEFVGLDYNQQKIEQGRQVVADRGVSGISLEAGDIWKLPSSWTGRFDGITVIHTLCVFRRIEPFIETLTALRPRWIAINSLFYPGPLDVLIHIRDHEHPEIADDNPDGDFNIFSLNRTAEVFGAQGYRLTQTEGFYPRAPLAKPSDGRRGTYTMSTDFSPRTQFSGPVHLPWHFLLAQRKH